MTKLDGHVGVESIHRHVALFALIWLLFAAVDAWLHKPGSFRGRNIEVQS